MDVKYSLTKLICYIVSVLAIFSVFAIMLGWFESSSWISSIGIELGIAYTTLILAISAVLVPAIGNSIKNQTKTQKVAGYSVTAALCIVFVGVGTFLLRMGFDAIQPTTLFGLLFWIFYNIILAIKKLWVFIVLIFVCYLINFAFGDSLINPESIESSKWAYRDGSSLPDLVSNSIDAGIRMVYYLLSLASFIMIGFGLKKQFQK